MTEPSPQGTKPRSASQQPAPRYGMRALAAAVAKVAKPALRRRGLATGRVVADWPEIVGTALAAQCLPERLTSGGAEHGGVLHIRVAGPLATELQHLEPLVIEKINTYFGYRAVERLRLIQGPMPNRPPRPAAARRAAGRDSAVVEASRAEIDARLGTMADGALRAALGRLGRAVADRGSDGRDSIGGTSGSDGEPSASPRGGAE